MVNTKGCFYYIYKYRDCQGTNANPFKILRPVRKEACMQAGRYGGPRTVSHRYTIVMTPAAAKNFSRKVNMILSFFCKMRTVYKSCVSKFYEQLAFFKTEPEKLPPLVNFAPQSMLSWRYRKREGGRYHDFIGIL